MMLVVSGLLMGCSNITDEEWFQECEETLYEDKARCKKFTEETWNQFNQESKERQKQIELEKQQIELEKQQVQEQIDKALATGNYETAITLAANNSDSYSDLVTFLGTPTSTKRQTGYSHVEWYWWVGSPIDFDSVKYSVSVYTTNKQAKSNITAEVHVSNVGTTTLVKKEYNYKLL